MNRFKTMLGMTAGGALSLALAYLFIAAGCVPLTRQEPKLLTEQSMPLEYRAFALHGTFVIYEEQAARLILNPKVNPAVKMKLQLADLKAKPIADALYAATRDFVVMRLNLSDTPNDEVDMDSAALALEKWVHKTDEAVAGLITAVQEH